MANSKTIFLFTLVLCKPSLAFMEQFFQQHQQQQQQQPQEPSYQDRYLNKNCNEYLCANTFQCVKNPIDCQCPFPDSQVKCMLPASDKNPQGAYVCVSRGSRDCKYVLDAHNGLV